MRQRRAKNMDERLQECSSYIVDNPSPSIWDGCFGNNEGKLFLEIGCGKGQFILKKALENPDDRFIAIEGQESVILRALEKASALSGREVINEDVEEQIGNLKGFVTENQLDGRAVLDNLKFTCTFVNEMNEFFEENQLNGVFLNFSDPWPKARHAKRRLTYRNRLLDYAWALKPGGFMEIKTDNDGLFDFTLEEIEFCISEHKEFGFKVVEMTRDLHASQYESRKTMTEYETKFSNGGKNINYVKILVEKTQVK